MINRDERSFDDFWNRIIHRAIQFCTKEIDSDFSSRTNLRVRDIDDFRLELEKTYKEKRNWLKSEYLPEEIAPSLDFHKLSAVLCRCLIGNKFYTYDTSKAKLIQFERKKLSNLTHQDQLKWEINNLYVNYKLAFLVGEGVAFDDLLFWAQARIDEDRKSLDNLESTDIATIQTKIQITEAFIDRLINKEHSLKRYYCSSHHDDFNSSIIYSLMKSDSQMRDFDYLSFGIIMFQWQEYTKRCIFSEIIEDLFKGERIEDVSHWLQVCIAPSN